MKLNLKLLAVGILQAAFNTGFGQSSLQFSTNIYSLAENAGTALLIVQRTGETNSMVTVDYATANGTAIAGSDYTPTNGTLLFAPGETNQTITVTILNDGVLEPAIYETLSVTLSNPTNAVLGARTIGTIRITDNDKGLAREFADYWAREDEGSVLIGVVRNDDGNFGVSVDFATSNLTATNGLDYAATNGTLVFAASEKVKLFTVPILNDGLKEANETFRITLSNPTNQVLASPTTATVTIWDNDPGVQFVPVNQYWIAEDEGALTLIVTRGNDGNSDPITVDFVTSNMTAIAGADYLATNGTLSFAQGEMVKTIAVPVWYDDEPEADEKFRVMLSNPTGSAVLGPSATATNTILDTTGMRPHRFDAVSVLPDRSAQFTLGGGVHHRFTNYFNLYPIEVSSNLVNWTRLVTLQRTNASTNAFTHTDPEATTLHKRFYRTSADPLITPLPQPSGPFAVGVVSRLLTDPSRRNRYRVSTNGSFMVSIWYPAVAEYGSRPGPLEDAELARDRSQYLGSVPDRRRSFVSHALPDAPCAVDQAPYPVVLFSHGAVGVRTEKIGGAGTFASHGYVVLAVDHWDAYGTVFPDGDYLQSGVTPVLSSLTYAGLQDRVKDFHLVLAELARWATHDPMFAGRLDLNRVATMGFSWGGGATGEIGRVDDRVKAVIFLDAYLQNADDLKREGLSKPFLGMYSDTGDNTLYNHPAAKTAIWFTINQSQHGHFTDYHWLAATPSDLAIARETARTADAFSLWFLNKYLKGLAEPMPTLAAYPRITGFKQK
jgi:dienelactone hydrolase